MLGGLVEGLEVVPGYRLAGRIGLGRAGEVWKAIGPGGFPLAMRFIGSGGADAAEAVRSLALMRDVRHPNLLTIFGSWQLDGLLVVGMELADGSLMDHHERASRWGAPGLSLPDLAAFMEQAARGVDFLNEPRHQVLGRDGVGLLHRDISPRSLLMVGGGVKLGDFGRVGPMDEAASDAIPDGPDAAYVAPELRQGCPSRWSDQYSLAATYCQLRGCRPLILGANPDEDALGHPGEFDLSVMPESERTVLARALSADPGGRWPDCRTFVGELVEPGRSEARPIAGVWRVAIEPDGPRPGKTRVAGFARPGSRSGLIALLILPLLSLLAIGLISTRRKPAIGRPPEAPARATVANRSSPSASPADLEIRESGAPTLPVLEPPPIGREDGGDLVAVGLPSRPEETPTNPVAVDQIDPGHFTAEVAVALGTLVDPARGRIRRAMATLRAAIATVSRDQIPDRPAAIAEGGAHLATPAGEVPGPEAGAKAVGPPIATADAPPPPPAPEPVRPVPMPEIRGPRGPAESSTKAPTSIAAGPREVEGPRTATISVWMPIAKAELVVKGAVGRGNPDEWYGPKRVIHSPPIAKEEEYLVGAFWMDPSGNPTTRTKSLKVQPGRSYVVDLRLAEPTSAEVKK